MLNLVYVEFEWSLLQNRKKQKIQFLMFHDSATTRLNKNDPINESVWYLLKQNEPTIGGSFCFTLNRS